MPVPADLIAALFGQGQQVGPPASAHPQYGKQNPLDRAFQPLDVSRFQQQPSHAAQLLQRNPGRDQFDRAVKVGAKKQRGQVDQQYQDEGGFWNAVNKAKKLSGMGSGFDDLIKSALWINSQVPVDDSPTGDGSQVRYVAASPTMKSIEDTKVKVSPDIVRMVARELRTEDGRNRLKAQVDQFRAARDKHIAATPAETVRSEPFAQSGNDVAATTNAVKAQQDREAGGIYGTPAQNLAKSYEQIGGDFTSGLAGNPAFQASLGAAAPAIDKFAGQGATAKLAARGVYDIGMTPARMAGSVMRLVEGTTGTGDPGDILGAAIDIGNLFLADQFLEAVKGGEVGLPAALAKAATPEKIAQVADQAGRAPAEVEQAVKRAADTLSSATPEEVAKALSEFHGGPSGLDTLSATGTNGNNLNNAGSRFGAFTTPSEQEAQRYAEMHKGGIVYAAAPPKNPYMMPFAEYDYFVDHTKGPRNEDGFRKALPPDQWEARREQLFKEVAVRKAELQREGYDGIVVPGTGMRATETIHFNDVPVTPHAPTQGMTVYRAENNTGAPRGAGLGKGVYATPQKALADTYGEARPFTVDPSARLLATDSPEYAALFRQYHSATDPEGMAQAIADAAKAAGYDGVIQKDGDFVGQVVLFDRKHLLEANAPTQPTNPPDAQAMRQPVDSGLPVGGQPETVAGDVAPGVLDAQGAGETPVQAGGRAQGDSAGAVKEPWQMTRDEYVPSIQVIRSDPDNPMSVGKYADALSGAASQVSRRLREQIADQGFNATEFASRHSNKDAVAMAAKDLLAQADMADTSGLPVDARRLSSPLRRKLRKVIQESEKQGARSYLDHVGAVRKALSEGKPVPPEVLADYPDLAKKYGALTPGVLDAQGAGETPVQAGGRAQGDSAGAVKGGRTQKQEKLAAEIVRNAVAGDSGQVARLVTPLDPVQLDEQSRWINGTSNPLPGILAAPRSDYRKPWTDYVLAKVGSGELTANEAKTIFHALSGDGVTAPRLTHYDDYLDHIEEAGRVKRVQNAWYENNVGQYGDNRGLIGENGVEQALKDGKPVPPEVLADYPDLAKKYGALTNETTQEANAVREVAQGQGLQSEGGLAQGQKAGQEADAVLPQEEGQVGNYPESPDSSRILYHATPSSNVPAILKNGVTQGMVTDSLQDAQEYAQMLRNRGVPDVAIVRVRDTGNLSEPIPVETVRGNRVATRYQIEGPSSAELLPHDVQSSLYGPKDAGVVPDSSRNNGPTQDTAGENPSGYGSASAQIEDSQSGGGLQGVLGESGRAEAGRVQQTLSPRHSGENVQRFGQEAPVGTKYAASNAASDDLRASAGLDPLEPSLQSAVTRDQAAATYDGQSTLSRARQIVEDNRAGVRPPVPTQEEVLHMDMAAAEAGQRMNQAKQALADAIDSGADPTEARRLYDMAREDVDSLTLASKAQGTEQSRAFSARNSAYFEDLTPAGVYRDFTVAKGAKLTDAEARQAEEMGRRLQKAESDIEVAKARAETARAQERIRELEQQARVAGRRGGRASGPRTAEQITAQRQAAVERIKARFADAAASRPMADPFGVQTAGMGAKLLADIAPDVMEVVRLYAEEGIVKLSEVVARVRHHVGEDVLSEGDVQRIIAGDYEHPPVTRSEAAKQVAQWRKELKTAGVGQETALKKSIADYEAKIKSGEFPARAPKPAIPDDLQKLYVRKEALKVEAEAMRNKIRSAEEAKSTPLIKKIGKEVFNVPRSVVATLDMSAGLNQGMFAAVTHPGVWGKSVLEGVKSIKNEADYYRVLGEVRKSEHYDNALAGGLKIGATSPNLDPGGDMMLSKLISGAWEVETPVGKVGLNPLAASERAYVATLEKLRMDMFSNMVRQTEKGGLFGAFGKRSLTLQDYKDIAEYVNTATGAGTGKIAESMKHFNNNWPVMFSPGYMVSRWKLASGTPIWNTIKRNPRVASLIVKDYVAFAGTASGLLLGLKASGANVELDVHSSNFGKVMVGDQWVDPFSGILAPYRVIAQITQGGTTQGRKPVKPWDSGTAFRYLENKWSPTVRTVFNVGKGVTGQESFGKSYDPRTAEGIKNTLAGLSPIAAQNVYEIWTDKSLNEAQKTAMTIGAVMGLSANTPLESKTKDTPGRSSSLASGRASNRAPGRSH